MDTPGKVVIVPTPIGNLADMTYRAVEILRVADRIACEDTRRTGRLLKHFEIEKKPLVAFFEHNETAVCERILDAAQNGETVALVTSAGMPGVSDPGFRLVSGARERGIAVEVLPGASAAITAVVASGLPVASFTFRGFPPRKAGRLQRFLEAEKDSPHTQVLYESPHRIGKFLAAAVEAYGESRRAVVCRELTKLHEEVRCGTLKELAGFYANGQTKGEITVVIEGAAV